MLPTTWHILANATALSALIPLLLSLFSDRSHGRRRCPKCWYGLDGVPAIPNSTPPTYTCPECATQTRESRLYKTRIRPRLLPLPFIILAASYTLWAIPRVHTEGWTGWVPTTAMALTVAGPDVDLLAVHSESFNKLRETFDERRKTRQLWRWQVSILETARTAAFAVGHRSGPSSSDRRVFDVLSTTYLRYDRTQPQTIADFCDSITQATGIPVLFDVDDVRKWGDRFSTSIELPPRCTITGALDQVFRRYLKPLDPDFQWRIDSGAVHVIMHDEPTLLFVTYPVADLLEERWVVPSPHAFSAVPYWADRSTELLRAITTVVTPAQWADNGGDINTTIEPFAGRLWVVAPQRTHLELRQLLNTLRSARGTTFGEPHPGELTAARDLYQRLAQTSLRPTPMPRSLGTLLAAAAAQSNITIEPDWAALEPRILSPDTTTHPQHGNWTGLELFQCAAGRNWPNSGLEWWTPDVRGGALIITDARRLDDTPMLVVHDVTDFVDFQQELELNDSHSCTSSDEVAKQVIDIITSTIDPDSWVDNGGDLASIHPLGHKLIIQARPFTQARVADLLDMVRAKRGHPVIHW